MAGIRLTPASEYLRNLITNRPGYLLKPPRPIPLNVRANSQPTGNQETQLFKYQPIMNNYETAN